MARSSENIAAAIEAVNGIIAEQNAALKALKDTLSQKAAGGVSLGDIDVYVRNSQTAENYTLISGPINALAPGKKVYYDITKGGEKVTTEFIVLGQSEQGNSTLIMFAQCFMQKRMHSSNVAEYNGCEADIYLDDEFLTTYFDEKFIAALTPTQIKSYSIANATTQTLDRKCFPLSCTELGWTGDNDEGQSYLPALKTWSGDTRDDIFSDMSARVAYNSAGTASEWWTRSAGSDSKFRCVITNGSDREFYATWEYWLRPVLSVANDIIVSEETEDTIYISPEKNQPYREEEATLFMGSSVKRPKQIRLLCDVENAIEIVLKVSNNAKDESPVWVTVGEDGMATLDNVTKTTENWELGVNIYMKSYEKAIVQEPVLLVATEG